MAAKLRQSRRDSKRVRAGTKTRPLHLRDDPRPSRPGSNMILCIGTTPAAQRVMVFRRVVPDSVNRAVTTLDGAAGKSVNVAKVLKALGEHPLATGFLGGDRGDEIRAILATKGVECEFVPISSPTRQCITVLDQ